MKYLRPLRWVWRWLWRCLPLFRAFGVPVKLHVTYLIFPGGFCVVAGWLGEGWRGALFLLGILALAVVCILIHEFAHVLTAARFGIPTRSVVVCPLGALALLQRSPHGKGEILMAAAGPAASLLLGAAALAGSALLGPPESYRERLWLIWINALGTFNLSVGFFNLLPCFPMDGGRILRGTVTLVIERFWPQRAEPPVLAATRLVVRFGAWPISMGMWVLTFAWTHLWLHLLIFILIPLLAEAELFVLRDDWDLENAPAKEPAGVQSNLVVPEAAPVLSAESCPAAWLPGEEEAAPLGGRLPLN